MKWVFFEVEHCDGPVPTWIRLDRIESVQDGSLKSKSKLQLSNADPNAVDGPVTHINLIGNMAYIVRLPPSEVMDRIRLESL